MIGGRDWGVSIHLHSSSLPIRFHGSFAETSNEECNEEGKEEVEDARIKMVSPRRILRINVIPNYTRMNDMALNDTDLERNSLAPGI